jgi:hypothetical protein
MKAREGFHFCNLPSNLYPFFLTSTIRPLTSAPEPVRYNLLVDHPKPFRLTESVKAAG